jgi:hypothetical protein
MKYKNRLEMKDRPYRVRDRERPSSINMKVHHCRSIVRRQSVVDGHGN